MKILFAIVILALISASLVADHYWKRWIRQQQQARREDAPNPRQWPPDRQI